MGDRVQKQLEGMVSELENLLVRQLFSVEEIKDIISKCRKFEYRTLSTDRCIALNGFKNYINYEIGLDTLLSRRLRHQRSFGNKKQIHNGTSATRSKVKIPVKVIFRRRIHKLFKRCLNRFVENVEMWQNYCVFCNRIKAVKVLNRVIMAALAKNPNCDTLWLAAVKYTKLYRGSIAAVNLTQRSLRIIPGSLPLYLVLLELHISNALDFYLHDPNQNSVVSKAWIMIAKHALKNLKDDDVVKFLFYAASLCSRIQRHRDFADALHEELKIFSGYISQTMFDQRRRFPILGLYVWQHKLLEAMILEKYKMESIPMPVELWNAILHDCTRCRELSRLFCIFMDVILSMKKDDFELSTSTSTFTNTRDPFSIELDFELSTNKSSANVTQFHGISALSEICFLGPLSPDFNEHIGECKYTAGLVSRKQLVAAAEAFASFFFQNVKDLDEKIKIVHSMESLDTFWNLDNGIVKMLKLAWQPMNDKNAYMPENLKLLGTLNALNDSLGTVFRYSVVDFFRGCKYNNICLGSVVPLLLGIVGISLEEKLNIIKHCKNIKLDKATLLKSVSLQENPTFDFFLLLLSRAPDVVLDDLEHGNLCKQYLEDNVSFIRAIPKAKFDDDNSMALLHLQVCVAQLHMSSIENLMEEESDSTALRKIKRCLEDAIECCYSAAIQMSKNESLGLWRNQLVGCCQNIQEVAATIGMLNLIPKELTPELLTKNSLVH